MSIFFYCQIRLVFERRWFTKIMLETINLDIILLLLTDFTEVFDDLAAILVAQDH